jgi:hypothetical protein
MYVHSSMCRVEPRRNTGRPFVEKTRRYSAGSAHIRPAMAFAPRYNFCPPQSQEGKVQGGTVGGPVLPALDDAVARAGLGIIMAGNLLALACSRFTVAS